MRWPPGGQEAGFFPALLNIMYCLFHVWFSLLPNSVFFCYIYQRLCTGDGVGSIGALPPDFFVMSSDELKREQAGKAELLERENMLRTKVRERFWKI